MGEDTSPEGVIRVIKRLCRHRYSLDGDRNRVRDGRLHDTAISHFGSWEEALTASGINIQNIRMARKAFTSERNQTLDALRQRHKLGQSLVACEVSRENLGLYNCVLSQFGCWIRGLLAAGAIEPSQVRRSLYLDHQQVINSIRKRNEEGRSLTVGAVVKEESILLYSARIYFSSWKFAIEVALQSPSDAPPIDK